MSRVVLVSRGPVGRGPGKRRGLLLVTGADLSSNRSSLQLWYLELVDVKRLAVGSAQATARLVGSERLTLDIEVAPGLVLTFRVAPSDDVERETSSAVKEQLLNLAVRRLMNII